MAIEPNQVHKKPSSMLTHEAWVDWTKIGAMLICWELMLSSFSTPIFGAVFHGMGVESSVIDAWFTVGYVDFFLGSFLALVPVIIYRQEAFFKVDLAKGKRRFSISGFGILFMLSLALSFCSSFLIDIMELGLNTFFNLSLMESADFASSASTTVTLFLYSVVAAPLCEELVFRGAVLRSLEKYGTGFGIVVSSLLFGAMHGNFLQFIDASVFGVILAIAAKRYSIWMAVLLHAANNLLVEIFGQMDVIFGSSILSSTLYIGILVFSVIGVVYYLIGHSITVKEVTSFLIPKRNVLEILKAPTIVVFFLFNFYFMIVSLISL